MTVVTLEDIDGPQGQDSRIHQFATDLFNHWGLGDPEVGNGLLVMLVKNKRALEVVTGRKKHTKSEYLVESAHTCTACVLAADLPSTAGICYRLLDWSDPIELYGISDVILGGM